MLAARQIEIALKRADVVDVDAALLVALVLAAISFFGASLLTTRIVRASEQLPTLDHLLHVAATTAHSRLLGAWRTVAGVTLGRAGVRIGRLATGERPFAGGLTQWNWISAGLA